MFSTEMAVTFNNIMSILYLVTLLICYRYRDKYHYNFLVWAAIIIFLPFIGIILFYLTILRRIITSR